MSTPEARREAARRWYDKNKEKKRTLSREYARDPQRKAARSARDKAKRQNETTAEKAARQEKRREQDSARSLRKEQRLVESGMVFYFYEIECWESGLVPSAGVLPNVYSDQVSPVRQVSLGSKRDKTEKDLRTPPEPIVLSAIDAVAYECEDSYRPAFLDKLNAITLVYPGKWSTDRFPLVRPRNSNRSEYVYDPMLCLASTISTFYQYYLTAAQQQNIQKSLPALHDGDVISALQVADKNMDANGFLAIVDAIQSSMLSKELYPSFSGKIPKELLFRIMEEVTQRAAASAYGKICRAGKLLTPATYGEILPSLAWTMFEQVNLSSSDHFVDLGAGLGLLLCQASAQSGCSSFGVELREELTGVGNVVLDQFQQRCRMWNIPHGPMRQAEGNMFKHPDTLQNLKRATVVLVCNLVFKQIDNEKLKVMLYKLLPNGARVISLLPFGVLLDDPRPRAMNPLRKKKLVVERHLPTQTFRYAANSVSWTANEGFYYIATVSKDSPVS